MKSELQRHRKRLSDDQGFLRIAAIDHRAVFSNAYNSIRGNFPSTEEITNVKLDLVARLSPYVSSYLLDPVYSAREAVQQNLIGEHGLVIGIEGEDYASVSFADDYLTNSIDVKGIADLGGDCVKLFLYYYEDEATRKKERALVSRLANECHEIGLPFLLEPIIAPKYELMDSRFIWNMYERMIDDFSPFGIDIFKLKFPIGLDTIDEDAAYRGCKNLISMNESPFILLTSGIGDEGFRKQLEIFCSAGGSGYAMGRSLWHHGLRENGYADMLEVVQKANAIVSRFGRACIW